TYTLVNQVVVGATSALLSNSTMITSVTNARAPTDTIAFTFGLLAKTTAAASGGITGSSGTTGGGGTPPVCTLPTGAVAGGNCKNFSGSTTSFQSSVMPVLTHNCTSCHLGGTGGFTINNNASDTNNCNAALAKTVASCTTSATSLLYLNSKGTSPHPGVNTTGTDQAAILSWIQSEATTP
ncbi:MAG: hypothetical protein ACXWP5_07770, partial [Bdellovibrionota bacterium]